MVRNKDRGVIFDGDDTLWETQPLYETAKEEFISLLREHGIVHDDPVGLLEKIDAQQVSSLGFSKERFSSSMVRAYEQICFSLGLSPEPEVERRLLTIARSIFEKTPRLYPDATDGLTSLKSEYMLVLATKGDPTVQEQRIEGVGIRPWFDRIYILERKTEREYAQIVNELQIHPSRMWVVGNSVKSDINPATRAGLRAIFIPRGGWEYESEDREEGHVLVVNSLSQAAAVIHERDRTTLDVQSRRPSRSHSDGAK